MSIVAISCFTINDILANIFLACNVQMPSINLYTSWKERFIMKTGVMNGNKTLQCFILKKSNKNHLLVLWVWTYIFMSHISDKFQSPLWINLEWLEIFEYNFA